jgi:YVTN family beta-propeller protein
VWVANASSNTVSEINASTGTVVATIAVGTAPYGVSSDGTHVGRQRDQQHRQRDPSVSHIIAEARRLARQASAIVAHAMENQPKREANLRCLDARQELYGKLGELIWGSDSLAKIAGGSEA